MGSFVATTSADRLLASVGDRSVDAIITSPPYTGLEGRSDTHVALQELAADASRVLADNGTLVVVVGATERAPFLPFSVGDYIANTALVNDGDLETVAWFVWQRPPAMTRMVRGVAVSTDFIIQLGRPGGDDAPLHGESIIRTGMVGFDYGAGVTMPPDLAAFLVGATTEEGDLVLDPFAGLGEVGVQARNQKRRFVGAEIDPSYARIADDRISARSA